MRELELKSMLAGLKAHLEHRVQLNLVADRYPPGIEH